jgi:hypothetical protein
MAAGTPGKDSDSGTSTRPGITENPLRRATPARHKGFFYFTGSEPLLFSVSTVTIFSAVAI